MKINIPQARRQFFINRLFSLLILTVMICLIVGIIVAPSSLISINIATITTASIIGLKQIRDLIHNHMMELKLDSLIKHLNKLVPEEEEEE